MRASGAGRESSNKINWTSAPCWVKSVSSFSVRTPRCQIAVSTGGSELHDHVFSVLLFCVSHANPKKLRHHGNHQLSCTPQSPHEKICSTTCCCQPVRAYVRACVCALLVCMYVPMCTCEKVSGVKAGQREGRGGRKKMGRRTRVEEN